MKEILEGCQSIKKLRQSEDEEQASLTWHSNDDYENEDRPVGNKQKGKQVIGDKNLVYLKMKENMKWHRTGRRNLRPEAKETAGFYMHSDNEYEEEQEEDLVDIGGMTKLLIGDKSLSRDIKKRLRGRPPDSGAETQPKRSRLDSISLKMLKTPTPPSNNQLKRTGIKRMFQSDKWLSSRFAKLDEGKEVERIVLNPTFWKKMQFVKKSAEPILQVLQKLDTEDRLLMASVYNDMYRAKLAIKAIHGDDMQKYEPYWSVVDNHWNSFHHPLYMAAYFLNPSHRYRPDFIAHPEVIRGLNECIVRLEPDNARRISASMQISDFVSAKADFGTELAISTRTELDPAAWWQQHGINCLELQRIAIRILSQTCSAFGCEHHWSLYDQIRIKTCNNVAQKRLNDLIYVHYNLRLRERQSRRTINSSISFDSLLLENLLGDWTVETETHALQEDEEILHDEMEQYEPEENEVHLDLHPVAVVEPLEVQPVTDLAANDDDEDLNLLDDLTD
ncbi:HAT dimerization domain [Macleaya cordata]|uniref:HAT dimerization domain n=1 Tax=Macleaya cordata TaxID=56857 RepID=A0A200QSS8_MACCD|nr:HAT dimerization domain [Macleaya cordata]